MSCVMPRLLKHHCLAHFLLKHPKWLKTGGWIRGRAAVVVMMMNDDYDDDNEDEYADSLPIADSLL